MTEYAENWRDPLFGTPPARIPIGLAQRLKEMAEQTADTVDVPAALAAARLPDLPHPMPFRVGMFPTPLRIYYERLAVLLGVAALAQRTDPGEFDLSSPATEAERRFGAVIGQAFHQGCSLQDLALATGVPGDAIIAIGKRTIRRTAWLQKL